MRLQRLDYPVDSAAVFERMRGLAWPVLLESGTQYLPRARFDIIAAEPAVRICSHGPRTMVMAANATSFSDLDPLEVVRNELGERSQSHENLPFTGGAIGYVAYDYGRRHERIGELARADIELPDIAMGIYDWAVVVDHLERACWLVGHGRDSRTFDDWDRLVERFSGPVRANGAAAAFSAAAPITSNLSERAYADAFERVKAHIAAGDCYQINLTQRFSARAAGDFWGAYRRLRRLSPAPYAAYLEYPFGQIASSSPELFLSVRDGIATTRPIKGTRARSPDASLDAALQRELASSPKDLAENVMIVDLLRNDFGRCCVAGSVHAPGLFEIETFANVHHLVSTVEGRLDRDRDAIDLLIACFPGGSITGAPKISAMQIIDSLEPQRRSIYCGSIGYIGYDGAMQTNIAIRTLLLSAGTVYAWAGGGIVADSQLQAEYQESFDKAAAMLQVLTEASAAEYAYR